MYKSLIKSDLPKQSGRLIDVNIIKADFTRFSHLCLHHWESVAFDLRVFLLNHLNGVVHQYGEAQKARKYGAYSPSMSLKSFGASVSEGLLVAEVVYGDKNLLKEERILIRSLQF